MLSSEEKKRYARQILVPEIGEAGQERLKAASVLVAGLGGLGSLAALYLAAAGIGALRLADRDRVSLSDLNRQLLYSAADIGREKTDAAAERLSALNAGCRLDPRRVDICEDPEGLLTGCDLLLDATDNLAARKALNQASVNLGIPMVHGGVDGFSGTVAVFIPGKSACLECLFPDPCPDCPAGPVAAVGPVVGIVASVQCTEALKLILGIGKPLADRLLVIRAGAGEMKTIRIRPNPECRLCACRPKTK